MAAATATRWGATIVEQNLGVGGGEIDLVIEAQGTRIAVEVKASGVSLYDAAERFDDRKQGQVAKLGRLASCSRVDLVCVHLGSDGYFLRWVPDAG